MSVASSIEWTDATWNPVTGCTKISIGCKHCYAERLARRLKAMGNPRYDRGFEITLHEDMLELPLKWRQPKMIFVNSMSDLFHENIPISFVQSVFATMRKAHWHRFYILTKRGRRLAEIGEQLSWPANVWMGVSLESQDYVWRVDSLRNVPASGRFLSCEPLLGSLELDLTKIDWVIAGGESGPNARPMRLDWVRSLRDQCRAADVAFFLKQLGGTVDKRGKDRALLDGQLWHEIPSRLRETDNVAGLKATLL